MHDPSLNTSFTLPYINTSSALLKVVITDQYGNSSQDVSNSGFNIGNEEHQELDIEISYYDDVGRSSDVIFDTLPLSLLLVKRLVLIFQNLFPLMSRYGQHFVLMLQEIHQNL